MESILGKAACVRNSFRHRNILIFLLTPVLLIFIIPLYPTKAGKCVYALSILIIYWITETLPIPVTALLPIPLFPWLNILGAREVSKNYFSDISTLILAGLVLVVAVHRWNLHRRIALNTLRMVGSQPHWLMLGFILTSTFISMWMINTVTSALMVPIAHAVISEIQLCKSEDSNKLHQSNNSNGDELDVLQVNIQDGEIKDNRLHSDRLKNDIETELFYLPEGKTNAKREVYFQELGLKFCVIYGTAIGGTATLNGTGSNATMAALVQKLYPGQDDLTYASWFLFALPNMLLSLVLAWFWLLCLFIGPKQLVRYIIRRNRISKESEAVKAYIDREYRKLGSITFAEVLISVILITTTLLWLTRKPRFMPGWADLLFTDDSYITDGSVGLTMALLLFILPSSRQQIQFCGRDRSEVSFLPLLDWRTVHHNLEWGVLILVGGTLAIAEACLKTGLSSDIGHMFETMTSVPDWVFMLLLTVITSVLTEFTSGLASCAILIPIVAKLAEVKQIHPFYLIFPVTISASSSFMLPIASPSNAIVFAYGQMKIIDMVKAGSMMNIICLATLHLTVNTYGYWFFKMDSYPAWANNNQQMETNFTLQNVSKIRIQD